MSSRADMIGSGPSSGHYQAGPTPTEEKSMPTYINDELLALGGIVNGILEGGAFPPQGKMPVRWREGMMMYFTEPLDDVYNVGQYKGQKIITSAGVWLYRRERWWKIVDDPSNVIGAVFAYRLTADGTPPSTPPPSSYPPSGWEDTAPVKNSKSEWIWISMAAAYDENTDTYTWNQPTPFSAGVEDGIDGQDGSDGVDGVRGTITVNKETSGSVWNDTEAYNAIINDPRSGGVVLNLDMVNLYNDSEEFSEQRFYSDGVWESFELFVDGNAIVTGTLIGDKIKSDTRITIGGNYDQDVVILDASDVNSRIWVGSTTSTSANFRVTPTGDLYANNGYFGGEVTYQGITGAIGGAVDSSLTNPIQDWSEWFVEDGTSTPTAIMARVTVPRQDYDRVAVVTCVPSLLIATSRTNVDRFGIVWTAANSTGSTLDYHYRVTSVTESGVGYSTTGNAASAFEFVAQNANQAWFKLTNTLAWEVFIPATTSTGDLTIDLKAQFLHATGQAFPVSNFVTFKVPNSTVNVEVSKVNSGISIIN
ncbi:hypothetical protein Q21_gp19 [Vibrio phage VPp1]|nr:hypothetical protein Q21_gp19 [Vibrio phage VPp1]